MTINGLTQRSGMVLALNAPESGKGSFADFQRAAEAASTGTASPTASSSPDSSGSAPSHSIASSGSASPSATQTGATPEPRGKHIPLAAIVGPIIGALVLLLCVAAIVVVRRRGSHRKDRSVTTAPRPFISLAELGIPDPAGDNGNEDAQPEPPILYEKDAQPMGSSSAPHSGSSSALPTATELALATMAEEMRLLRGQVQRLESDRRISRISTGTAPPDYATRPSETSSVESI
ncbi:hypothetical protein C8R44DRAFT_941114 [Mycena epipterygia]|nr:hypothetical protein C8R44DRAFT_941114 [Mycena epipterygia]